MDKPIAVGDLVMVVRWPHKCLSRTIAPGMPFVVSTIFDGSIVCDECGHLVGTRIAVTPDMIGIPCSWLKRIDPLSEPESVTEEATA